MEPDHGLSKAERVLKLARDAAGIAAYHYFFLDSTPDAREVYLAAIEAEAEADLLLYVMRDAATG